MTMNIWYGPTSVADAKFHETLHRLASAPGVRRVCEIGGGANPALDLDFLRRHRLEYTVVDVAAEELGKAPAEYRRVQADISRPGHGLAGGYDLIFSRWCLEHVPRAEMFHREVHQLLAPAGRAFHLFPTLYSLPFVLNRLIPEAITSRLLLALMPHRVPDGDHGKFPASYRWCRGPSRSQLRRLAGVGFTVEEYAAFFGHSGKFSFGSGYLNRIPLLCRIHEEITRLLLHCPVPTLTTYAYVVMQKGTSTVPADSGKINDQSDLDVAECLVTA